MTNELTQEELDRIEAVRAAWKERGIAALDELAERDPIEFVKLFKSLFPEEFEIDAEDHLANLPDDKLERFQAIAARLRAH